VKSRHGDHLFATELPEKINSFICAREQGRPGAPLHASFVVYVMATI
jgi:hypothetical protein